MTEVELSKRIAKKTGLTRKLCDELVDALIDEIRHGLMTGQKISLRKLLTIEAYECAERKCVDLKTGEETVYPPSIRVKCRTSKFLRDELNGKQGIDGS